MIEKKGPQDFPLSKKNFQIIAVGAVVVIIGFFLMSGGGADDSSSYSDAIYDLRRWYIAPITILFGYGLVMFGIIKK